jgi:hypothetical protein
MNNDWVIRILLSLVAGLTYLAGAIPADLTIDGMASLPVQIWILLTVNMLTGLLSPSVIKRLPIPTRQSS